MRLSRLSNRQLKRLLAKGEVRFGDGYDPRFVSEYYRWTERGKAQFERRIKETLKYIVESAQDMNVHKGLYKEQLALSNALKASLAAWEALDRKIYELDNKRQKEFG